MDVQHIVHLAIIGNFAMIALFMSSAARRIISLEKKFKDSEASAKLLNSFLVERERSKRMLPPSMTDEEILEVVKRDLGI